MALSGGGSIPESSQAEDRERACTEEPFNARPVGVKAHNAIQIRSPLQFMAIGKHCAGNLAPDSDSHNCLGDTFLRRPVGYARIPLPCGRASLDGVRHEQLKPRGIPMGDPSVNRRSVGRWMTASNLATAGTRNPGGGVRRNHMANLWTPASMVKP